MSDYFQFLDNLKESGIANMFGATPYLEKAFDLDKKEAQKILIEWMEQYTDKKGAEAIITYTNKKGDA